MKTQLIILEQGNIIVSDEKIIPGDYYYLLDRNGDSQIFNKPKKIRV